MAFGTNDTLNFCLMTTANYLTKALVMYDSLVRECKNDFNLFYFAFDDLTFEYLNKLNYKNITPILLKDLENYYPELLGTKSNRNISEYFFTCTPHIIDYALKNFEIDHVTYLDADLYFYKDPRYILNELKENSVLITEHRYYPEAPNHTSGKYCVQFIPFKNDTYGNTVLDWYRQKCIEWCYLKAEDGKWADQGYLNDWPERFEKIIVMENRGGGIASWNLEAYIFKRNNGVISAYNKEIKKDVDAIFYHFQGLKIYNNRLMNTGLYKNQKNVYNFIYKDYIYKLGLKENELRKKLNIKRTGFEYPAYDDSFLRLILSIGRRILLPKKSDLTFYFKYTKRYKWLP